MTTVTDVALEAIDEAVAAIDADVTVVEQREFRKWEPRHVKGIELNERASDFAAQLADMPVVDTTKGIKFTDKAYYQTVSQDASREEIERIKAVDADFVAALHAVSSDIFLDRATQDKELDTMGVKANLGPGTTYTDRYSRHDVRSVSQGPKAERISCETYGYHNPHITTEYKGMNDSRVAVHNLAKDLLG